MAFIQIRLQKNDYDPTSQAQRRRVEQIFILF